MSNIMSFLSFPLRSKSDVIRLHRRALALVLAFSLLSSATTISVGPANSQLYLNDIKTLAAPDMEGRGAGTRGLEKASKYLEHRYKALGLQPAGTNGYLQPFTVTTGAKLKSDNSLTEDIGGKKHALVLNQDFVPASFSSSGSFTSFVVFVGYGA